jgi:cation diffusion facilitator family transporter
MADESRKVLYVGLAGNVLVTVSKFAAAAATHSSAMLSEAVHSLVDTSNGLLLIYGAHRSAKPPDARRPLGYGRDLYFWSFLVSLFIFGLGAGFAVYEGIRHILHPVPIENPLVNYAVLALAVIFEGGSWVVAFREFRRRKGDRGYLEAAEETKDPRTLMVFLEDSAALAGIALAFAGMLAAQLLGEPRYDGAASIAIGVLLAVVAGFLIRENKQLLLGESASPEMVRSICGIAATEPGVAHLNGLLTFQMGPRQVVAALSLDFGESLRARELQEIVARLEARVRSAHPEIVMLLVKPQTPEAYRDAEQARYRWREP